MSDFVAYLLPNPLDFSYFVRYNIGCIRQSLDPRLSGKTPARRIFFGGSGWHMDVRGFGGE